MGFELCDSRNVTFEIIQTDQSSLKTHNNANPPTGKVVDVSRNYTSVLSTVKRIYANEGFPGFFKVASPMVRGSLPTPQSHL